MDIVFNISNYYTVDKDEILKTVKANQETLSIHSQKLNQIMALIDDLKQEVADLKTAQADLQASVDLEQEQIAALLATNAQVVTTLNEKIAALELQVAESPSPEALQAVIDDLKVVKDSLATTKADIEGTVTDPPIESPTGG